MQLLRAHTYRMLCFSTIVCVPLWSCKGDDQTVDEITETPSAVTVADTSIVRGKTLASRHCSSCHLLPAPDLLDKTTWKESVLPNMAARLGLRYRGYDPFEGVEPSEVAEIKALNIYPEQALLSEADWQSIVHYYEQMAPAELPAQNRTSATAPEPPPFTPNLVEIGDKPVPQVTLLEYDQPTRTLFIGDHLNLYALDQQGAIVGNWQTQSPSSDIARTERGIFLLSIGAFKPSEKKEGVFFPLTFNAAGKAEDYVVTELPRPVQFDIGDLNGDQKDDVVICGFGNHRGQLAWYDNFRQDQVHLLSGLPGARKALIRDMNGDGMNDVVALMAQAWEKVVIYYNKGNGEFREETVLELPAVYGVSYFDLVDFNDDGHPDLLLTNGDNWDYSSIQKPYHGIRIYLNDGSNQFTPTYFYPMYGCSEARAVDFDRDGDLDLAAIAFYDNRLSTPDESFVYLRNEGQLSFSAHYMPETACGKWLTMDVGDFDNDGYPDIFLGSYFHNVSELSKVMTKGVEAFPEVLLLRYQPQ